MTLRSMRDIKGALWQERVSGCMYGEKGTDVHTHGNSVTRPLSFQVRERLRVALERCSLLEEELGATHKEVSLISHRVISAKGLSLLSLHYKKE